MAGGKQRVENLYQFGSAGVIYRKRREALEKTDDEIYSYLQELAIKANLIQEFAKREEEVGKTTLTQAGRAIILQTVDYFWQDHLDTMEHVRDAVRCYFAPLTAREVLP